MDRQVVLEEEMCRKIEEQEQEQDRQGLLEEEIEEKDSWGQLLQNEGKETCMYELE